MSKEKLNYGSVLVMELRAITKKIGLREFCRQHDLDPGNVSNVLNLKKPLQESIVNALGYESVKVYRKLK